MARSAVVFVLIAALSGCAPARYPAVGRAGMVMAIAGVATIITAATLESDRDDELMTAGSLVSAAGLLAAAAHQLSTPEVVYVEEPEAAKLIRWARILTEHAAGAARSGNCVPVRKFEPRVRVYDLTYHDLVFMKDPEILRCLGRAPTPAPVE